MKQYRLNPILFFILFLSFAGFGQNEIFIQLKWDNTPGVYSSTTEDFMYPNLENSFISSEEFYFLKEFQRNSINGNWKFNLLNYQSEPADEITKKFINRNLIEIGDSPVFSIKNNSKRGEPTAVLKLVPFVKINGEIRKITSISFKRTINNQIAYKSQKYASSSVLKEGSGDWYKISVKEDGVYKIDYQFLKALGINMGNLNPKHINIYGNGFGRLPELNSEFRPDDLLKNDILIEGEDDGKFDESDYIVFYGKGPHKWVETNGSFRRVLNNYANHSAYFININPNSSPARIQTNGITNKPTTHIVSDYDSYTIHEEETRNLMKSGQRWYGEIFDANLSQSFSLFIPNLNPNGKATIRGAMASKEGSLDNNTYFEVSYNNTTIGKAIMPQSDADSYSRGIFSSGNGVFKPQSNTFSISVTFNRVSPSDAGYLDYLEVNARSFLKFFDGMQFRDLNSVGVGNIAQYEIENFPTKGIVWEITEPTSPKIINGTNESGTYKFKIEADSLRQFFAFNNSKFLTPSFTSKIEHQNLHAFAYADYLMVTHPLFLKQAERLADLHRNNGLSVHVVTTQQIYNEFSGGTQDPTAIKFFAKMFYDRANGNPNLQPKYLLLFGDGTYDPLNRVSNNNNMAPVYETINSESYTASIVSDDYFGFLDDSEEFDPDDLLDIAVGRLIATTEIDAVNLVNKIEHYMKNGSNLYASNNLACGEDGFISTHGDWRQHYTVIADDEEHGYFIIKDLEPVTNYVKTNHPEMNVKKIYSDAYLQITTAGGERYPDVNSDIVRSLESGTLLTCFVGHGGPSGAASERIITIGEVQNLRNIGKLTLFISATCEFARIDDNERVSIGEWMALNEVGGAIALMTTSRAVYFSTNSVTTTKFFENVFVREADGTPKTFGEIITLTKNGVLGGSNNKRSFMLLGDPALRIALPYHKVVLDSINGNDVSSNNTIQALSKVNMSGHIEDQYGNLLNQYNGIIQPSIYDKPSDKKTLGQDANSPVIDFQTQENVLFRGKATVKEGRFDFDFIVPKDIDYSYGKGKVSFYSWNNNDENAGGYSDAFDIGGIDTVGLNDTQGPEIELFLNNEDFVNGGITNEMPILIAKLYDESGINTVGNGIGHDITLILDDKTSDAKVLNEYYESDLDTYKSGELRYQLEKLEPGRHTLTFKAWDVNNNSSEYKLEFNVQEKQEIAIDHLLNYPNPFTTHTEFFFEHNQVCSSLEAQIQIFTVSGRLVRTINQLVETSGFRSKGIAWDGKDDFGDQLAKGVYIYRLTVESPEGEQTQKVEKLYLLR